MLQIYNTLTKTKEEFKPQKKSIVSFYHCGPTVYWVQHIGNMRAMVLADLIVRSLEYLGYKVNLVRNYTDVGHLTSDEDEGEDKMSKRAKTEKSSPEQIAEKYIKIFEQDITDLNIEPAWKKPRATKHVQEMINLVQILLDKGYAYTTDLAVYFDVTKFENYTKLSGQKLEQNILAAGKGEVSDKNKKHPADFALWFFKVGAHQNALQTWPSPFESPLVENGEGFPGWHIECSAMSQKYLGETIDIHMGGVEHIPVHHTNEIAQSEAATGKPFVRYWLHNEHLTVDGGKMSKSEGTAYTLSDIKVKGYDPMVLRYFFCQAHYRSKQNFTWEALKASKVALDNLRDRITSYQKRGDMGAVNDEYNKKFITAIEDDFNISQALAVAWEMGKSNMDDKDKWATWLKFDRVLGLGLDKIETIEIPPNVAEIAEARERARQQKDWEASDKLREQIISLGFEVEDNADGYHLKKIVK